MLAAIKVPPIDVFFRDLISALFGAGQMECFPTQRALFFEDGNRPKSVAAVQRDGMVEDVEDAHNFFVKSVRSGADKVQ